MDSKKLTLSEFAKLNGVHSRTVWRKMKLGWSCMEAVTFRSMTSPSLSARNHGLRKSSAYSSWASMKMRCKRDEDYTERGITVCERWENFRNFYADMGPRPNGTTLDRIDTYKGYEPQNCRWADNATQARNTTVNVMIEYGGERLCATDWERKLCLARGTIRQRLSYGFTPEQAVSMKRYQKR